MMNSNQKHLLFVYGTLKRGYGNHHYLGDDAIFYGKAKVTNVCLYHGPGFPYAFLTDDGAIAKGELYQIDDAALARCDSLEGYPYHYDRKKVLVVLNENTIDDPFIWTEEAWIYVSPNQPRGSKIESGEWNGRQR